MQTRIACAIPSPTRHQKPFPLADVDLKRVQRLASRASPELVGHHATPLAILALQQRAGNRAVAGMLGHGVGSETTPGTRARRSNPGGGSVQVQRRAEWRPGEKSREYPLAIEQVARRENWGFTPPMLNGAVLRDEAGAAAVLRGPKIKITQADGWVGASLGEVPDNAGSFMMYLPTSPPWLASTTVERFFELFMRGKRPGPLTGPTQFRLRGHPNDEALASQIETHEHHHAADHREAFEHTIQAWDRRMVTAWRLRREWKARSEADAKEKLFSVIGAPESIARAFWFGLERRNAEFHRSPAGERVLLGPADISPSGTRAWAVYFYRWAGAPPAGVKLRPLIR